MVQQVVYKEGTNLYQMLHDSWSRDLTSAQVIAEVGASGFVVDEALVTGIYELFYFRMKTNMECTCK